MSHAESSEIIGPRSYRERYPTAFLALLVVLAGLLRLIGLWRNGYGSAYYAATVRSMLSGWSNWFYGAFDPGGFLAVDKPPVAFWIQSAFAGLWGYSGLSLLLPQAIGGVAAVVLLYFMVRRGFGHQAAGLAALVLAVTPVSVALDRSNLPDSLLVVSLLLAAAACLTASARGSLPWLLATAALVGLAFHVKMLAAWVIVPALSLVYLLGAPLSLRKRLVHLLLAGVVMVFASLLWVMAVDMTPENQRPYVGDTEDNRALSLVLGWNGVNRLVMLRMAPGGGPGPGPGFGPEVKKGPIPKMPRGGADGVGGRPGPRVPPGFSGFPSLFRLFNPWMGGQIGWLIPLALGGLYVAWRGRSGEGVNWRQLGERERGLVLWGGWLVSVGLLLSLTAGIIHPYYGSLLAPAVAAGVGVGVPVLWVRFQRRSGAALVWLLLATLLAQAWIVGLAPLWRGWLIPLMAGLVLGGVVLLVVGRGVGRRCLMEAGLAAGLSGLLVAPVMWSGTSLAAPAFGMMPVAGPELLLGAGRIGPPGANGEVDEGLLAFLMSERRGERFLLATADIHGAAPFIIEAGEPVMAVGGFMGSDPILTPEEFAEKVEQGEVRFVLTSERPIGPRPPGMRENPVIAWAKEHGVRVSPERWGVGGGGEDRRGPRSELYDCRTDKAGRRK